MPVKVRSHIDERGLRTLAEVGSAADHFALTNPNYYCRSNEPSFPSNQHNSKRMEYSTRRTDLPDTHRTVNAKSETGGESRNIASRGFISADESCTSSSPVTILRDSAADISLVLKEAVPNPDCYTGEMVIINGLIGSKSIPICEVYLKSDLISGYVRLGVVDRIPSDGISFLMGNDLVGDKVWPCPVVSLFPAKENNTVDLEREYPDLFPACAVTRSASRRTSPPIEALTTGTTLSDESPCDVITEEFTLADFFDSSAKVSSKCTSDNSDIVNFKGTPVTKEKLIEEQTKDPDLKVFYDRLTEISELENSHTCYYLQSGVLMRKYKPYNISADDTSKTVHQIVIPKSLQIDVLNIAHDISGHLGVKKTYYKILAHFYWPKMKRDVSSYCQSCHICQVKGKPGAGIKPYPLQPIPVLREPFSTVVIDCRTSDVNYVIETPKRRRKQRHVHVNLLKKYYERVI
ncbi:uncharacterized protein LOC119592892 [Penaeus monodon]|uniref:uncharacterized protein LOC119592892 n=1 Tax=Penaeus monodon TaxID=6687 RepID=UPI0018A77E04|nr:uncharacterized protein LOC119592892 [Penaeus monodon]